MEFDNARIDALAGRIGKLLPRLSNEEATKASLVTPFIAALGYDPHDPHEVEREYGADAGRGGEAVDYAIMKDGRPIIMIEAKHHDVALRAAQERQLRRYFNATPECRIGLLTNGIYWKAFSDIRAANVMDDAPFAEWDMLSLDAAARKQIRDLSAHVFSVNDVIRNAEASHYGAAIHELLRSQAGEPDRAFVRWLGKQVYDGSWTPRVAERFSAIVSRVMREFVSREVQAAPAATAGEQAPAPKPRRRIGRRVVAAVSPEVPPAARFAPPQDLVGKTIAAKGGDYPNGEELWRELTERCEFGEAPPAGGSAFWRLEKWFGIEFEELDAEDVPCEAAA